MKIQSLIHKLENLGGIKPNVINNNKQTFTSEEDSTIMVVQENFDEQIPKDYIQLITKVKAFTFEKSIQIKAIDNVPVSGKDNKIHIDNFFDFSENEASIINTLKRFKGNLPRQIMPICEGGPGDLIGINLSSENYGKIYYWYHEEEYPDSLYLIADNLNLFINGLFVKESDDDISTDGVKMTKVTNKFLERLKKSGKL